MELKKLTLQRFFGFEEFTIEFNSGLNVLIGPNNGGKTTILRAVKFVRDVTEIIFGTPQNPKMGALNSGTPLGSIADIVNRGGMGGVDALFFRKDVVGGLSVVAEFEHLGETLILDALSKITNSPVVGISASYTGTPASGLTEPLKKTFFEAIFRLQCEFLPAPGPVSASEKVLDFTSMDNRLKLGQYDQVWKNRLHWLSEGREPLEYQIVGQRVAEYFPGITFKPPRRGSETNFVEFPYLEGGIEHDITVAGAGTRTVLAIIMMVEFSDVPILLLDEPDSHLHPSLQRQLGRYVEAAAEQGRMVLLTTHAPDVIEEVPIDSLIWVDKSGRAAKRCDTTGKALVDLGATSHAAAIAHAGADVLLYFEDKIDSRTFELLLDRCGKADILARARIGKLGGFGGASKLPGVLDVLKNLLKLDLAIAAVLDADYSETAPGETATDEHGVLILRLPCKELENLVLDECVILAAVDVAAKNRQGFVGGEVTQPTRDDVKSQIDAVTASESITKSVRSHWIRRWAVENRQSLDKEGVLTNGENQFDRRWAEADYRRRCCPGKQVLKQVFKWLQDNYKISISVKSLFQQFEPDDALRAMCDRLEQHINDAINRG